MNATLDAQLAEENHARTRWDLVPDLNGVATHLPRLVALNRSITAVGAPGEVLVPEVLERTYGAPFEVLVHAGLRLVVDAPGHGHGHTHAIDGGPAR